jgi:hypothetical protein
MKALWDGVYSFVTARKSTPLYAGIATDQHTFPYVVYNVGQLEAFDYSSKEKGWDLYEITFDIVSDSMQEVGDCISDLWDMFESGSPSVAGYTYAASYRGDVNIALDTEYDQSGKHIWIGTMVIEAYLYSNGITVSSSSSSPTKSSDSSASSVSSLSSESSSSHSSASSAGESSSSEGWMPSDLGTLAAWYDAGDASTITIQTGVSEWRDKSRNNRHISQANTSLQPAYDGSSKVTFNGTSHYLFSTSPFMYSAGAATVYIVCKDGGSSADDWVIAEGNSATTTQLYSPCIYGTSAAMRVMYRTNDATTKWNETGLNTAAFDGTINLLGFTDTGTSVSTYIDAVVDINAYAYTRLATTLDRFSIGALVRSTIANHWNGDIHEIVICSSALSQTDREKLEGYLAWNNGTQANLPVGHPYKNAAP